MNSFHSIDQLVQHVKLGLPVFYKPLSQGIPYQVGIYLDTQNKPMMPSRFPDMRDFEITNVYLKTLIKSL